MAKTKISIDYYPCDVSMLRDRKFTKIRQKYGSVAYVIYIALLEMIYSDKGYYLDYNDTTKDDVLWELQEYCRGKYMPDLQTISEVIEMLVACGLFDGDHFKQGIITSRRIQKTYYRVTVDRRNVVVNQQIWLLDLAEMKEISAKSSILQSYDNQPNIAGTSGEHRPIDVEYQPINNENHPNLQQIKENKIKENKSKVNDIYISPDGQHTQDIPIPIKIIQAYFKYSESKSSKLDKDIEDTIKKWLKTFESELIIEAFKLSKGKSDFIATTKEFLRNWYEQGITDSIELIFGTTKEKE